MKKFNVEVSSDTKLEDLASLGISWNGEKTSGKVKIPVTRQTRRRLNSQKLPGETDNECLRRLLKVTDAAGTGGRGVPFYGSVLADKPDLPPFPATGTEKEVAEKIQTAMDRLDPKGRAEVLKGMLADTIRVDGDHPYVKAREDEGFDAGYTARVSEHLLNSPTAKVAATIKALLENPKVGLTAAQREKLERAVARDDRMLALETVLEHKNDLQSKSRKTEAEISKLAREEEGLTRQLAAAEDIVAMGKAPKLQRLGETGYHKAMAAFKNGTMILPYSPTNTGAEATMKEIWGEVSDAPQIFVVQHDWASAFAHATDFADGEVILPFPLMVFEFRISGHRTCCAIWGDDGHISGCIITVETSAGWCVGAAYDILNSTWTAIDDKADDLCGPITNLCRSQIRAICIALEAEVAVTEVVRAPHKLNRKRERAGKLPIFDHHIVSLAHRKRYAPRAPEPGDIEEEVHHKRLHFVRGHYRHFTNSKTWIKWHLRGDPDLGFVDKEYRL